jgi:hypothetical protein
MASLDTYRPLIENILMEYTKIPYAYSDIQTEAVFDHQHDRYLLVNVGWDNGRRIHSGLVHIDIINDKLWIQRDDTEEGVTQDLLKAGIPKEQIVLGFHPAEVRPHTGYAAG